LGIYARRIHAGEENRAKDAVTYHLLPPEARAPVLYGVKDSAGKIRDVSSTVPRFAPIIKPMRGD
jgi:hypothetical protein